jgi:glutathione synthase/RimK-type ligase-like ATP-grasp enzyme
MEFVSAPREYRVHIFNGKSIRISEKAFGETGTSSTGNYTTRKPQHDVSHVREAAKKAMQAVGLDFGAVDVLANDNQAWVLECNSAPHLGGTLPKLYADNFRKYFES